LQWLYNPSQTWVYYLNNVRHEASRIFRKKKREYLKEKKFMSLKQTVRPKTSETYIDA